MFKFGCDPELFVVNSEGKPIPAWDMIPGTKAEPHKVEYGAVQVDGCALEFNIDPAETFEEWDRNIVQVMRQMKGMIPKGYKFLISPSVEFAKEEFDKLPEEALELGCEPDFCAYTGAENPRPTPEEGSTLRTAAGHIHIGWTDGVVKDDPEHFANCIDIVKQFDWHLGASSVFKDASDEALRRRILYGKAGAFRPKPYGVEYRTLSNFWISTKANRKWAWDRVNAAIKEMPTKEYSKTYSPYQAHIISAIDENNKNWVIRNWGTTNWPIGNMGKPYGI